MMTDNEIRGMTLNQLGRIEMTFGKHRGKKLDDVPLQYLVWCNENGVCRGDLALQLKCYLEHPRTCQELDKLERRGF